jgi:hypothetical protein
MLKEQQSKMGASISFSAHIGFSTPKVETKREVLSNSFSDPKVETERKVASHSFSSFITLGPVETNQENAYNLAKSINFCLAKLDGKKWAFGDNNTITFDLYTEEDQQTYTVLLEAIRLFRLVWPSISTEFGYGWVEKTVFDATGRNTNRTCLFLELKPKKI